MATPAPSSQQRRTTKYHRFRDGERCDECGARQWYAENALRYCRNGHRLEGFAAHEEDEDAFGTRGRVSRKKRGEEADTKAGAAGRSGRRRGSQAAVKLAGDAGRELYLEVLQLVLRRQVTALGTLLGLRLRGGAGAGAGGAGLGGRDEGGSQQGAAAATGMGTAEAGEDDLEHVVRSLWVLRVRNLPLKAAGSGSGSGRGKGKSRAADESEGEGERGGSRGGGFSSGFSSGSQTELDASQSSDFDGGNYSDASRATTARSWDPDARSRWKLPKLVDTLALCYLACLVKRLPVTTADFHRWAQRGDIDFLAAINNIPKNVRDRLPAEYHRALQVRDHIKTGYLQTAVQQLVISFHLNFDLVLPPLNYVPILVRHIKDLLLPVETYPAAKCMAEIMKADFAYPYEGKRIRSMSNPEVLLITLVIVAAKLLYSLDGVERAPRSDRDPRCLRLDWAVWREAVEDKEARRRPIAHLERGQEYKVTPNDALTMDKTKLDDYMDWFENMWIGESDAATAEVLQEPFVHQKRTTSPMPQNTGEEDSDRDATRRYRMVHRKTNIVEVVPDAPDDDEDARQPRDFCPVWRSEEDLPDTAKMLYREAAELAAIPLLTLIRAASQVERRLEVWCIQRAKERRWERGKGKGKAMETVGVTDSDE